MNEKSPLVRVKRLLVYEGPADWVETTLERGGVPRNGTKVVCRLENEPFKQIVSTTGKPRPITVGVRNADLVRAYAKGLGVNPAELAIHDDLGDPSDKEWSKSLFLHLDANGHWVNFANGMPRHGFTHLPVLTPSIDGWRILTGDQPPRESEGRTQWRASEVLAWLQTKAAETDRP